MMGVGQMDISALCAQIGLQPEIKKRVMDFAEGFDFSAVDQLLKAFRNYERMGEARKQLQAILSEDADQVKMLACMLKASADLYDVYQRRGICDQIYFDTMRCYTRFLDETCEMTGRLYFDRAWWTVRQAGGHLFRIGALEYEIEPVDDRTVLSIHIPSDADLSPPGVDRSLGAAKEFFRAYCPRLENAEYRCRSWLLDRRLQGILNRDSNIARFQDRFAIIDEGEVDTEYYEWLFHTKSAEITSFPENTSLQRNVKRYLLSGGAIRNTYGKLR